MLDAMVHARSAIDPNPRVRQLGLKYRPTRKGRTKTGEKVQVPRKYVPHSRRQGMRERVDYTK